MNFFRREINSKCRPILSSMRNSCLLSAESYLFGILKLYRTCFFIFFLLVEWQISQAIFCLSFQDWQVENEINTQKIKLPNLKRNFYNQFNSKLGQSFWLESQLRFIKKKKNLLLRETKLPFFSLNIPPFVSFIE